jgi:cytochrome c-type biogenesis protein CcmE
MHPIRFRKLQMIVWLIGLVGVASGLMLYALRQNINLFYTPSQILEGKAPMQHTIRVGGMVVQHSIVHAKTGLQVDFQVTDYTHTLEVTYTGVLPDLFREGQGVVVQGELLSKTQVKATQVLAKHDENYMPPEVRNAIKKPSLERSV